MGGLDAMLVRNHILSRVTGKRASNIEASSLFVLEKGGRIRSKFGMREVED